MRRLISRVAGLFLHARLFTRRDYLHARLLSRRDYLLRCPRLLYSDEADLLGGSPRVLLTTRSGALAPWAEHKKDTVCHSWVLPFLVTQLLNVSFLYLCGENL